MSAMNDNVTKTIKDLQMQQGNSQATVALLFLCQSALPFEKDNPAFANFHTIPVALTVLSHKFKIAPGPKGYNRILCYKRNARWSYLKRRLPGNKEPVTRSLSLDWVGCYYGQPLQRRLCSSDSTSTRAYCLHPSGSQHLQPLRFSSSTPAVRWGDAWHLHFGFLTQGREQVFKYPI